MDNDKKDKHKAETAEMCLLHSVGRVSLWNQKRSTDIRKELDIFNLNDKLEYYKQKWKNHLERMEDEQLSKKDAIIQTQR
jgi:hypothetical protein